MKRTSLPFSAMVSVGLIVAIFSIGNIVIYRANSRVQTLLTESNDVQIDRNLVEEFKGFVNANSLGYMDAIVDRDSKKVDKEILEQHEQFKKWSEENWTKLEDAAVQYGAPSAFKDLTETRDTYLNEGAALFADIVAGKTEGFDKHDDIIDEASNKLKKTAGAVLSKINDRESAINNEISSSMTMANQFMWSVATMAFLIASALGWLLRRRIQKDLSELNVRISEVSRSLEKSSNENTKAGQTLNDLSQAAASATEQTAASVTQILATSERNASSARSAGGLAEESRSRNDQSRESLQQLRSELAAVEDSFKALLKQAEENQQTMQSVVQFVEEIRTKTNVINEIVFQTKLLSFNASVEAARAGESGKGFSVVAHEIGQLAQMSGSAAAEIQNVLTQSTDRIQSMTRKTELEMSEVTKRAEGLLQRTVDRSQALESVLNTQFELVMRLRDDVLSISRASEEQSQGVAQIQSAMVEVTRTVEQSRAQAQGLHEVSNEISHDLENLQKVSVTLKQTGGLAA